MTYRDRTKAICGSILLILKNATVIIPVIEGIIYTLIDSIKTIKKGKQDGKKILEEFKEHEWQD